MSTFYTVPGTPTRTAVSAALGGGGASAGSSSGAAAMDTGTLIGVSVGSSLVIVLVLGVAAFLFLTGRCAPKKDPKQRDIEGKDAPSSAYQSRQDSAFQATNPMYKGGSEKSGFVGGAAAAASSRQLSKVNENDGDFEEENTGRFSSTNPMSMSGSPLSTSARVSVERARLDPPMTNPMQRSGYFGHNNNSNNNNDDDAMSIESAHTQLTIDEVERFRSPHSVDGGRGIRASINAFESGGFYDNERYRFGAEQTRGRITARGLKPNSPGWGTSWERG